MLIFKIYIEEKNFECNEVSCCYDESAQRYKIALNGDIKYYGADVSFDSYERPYVLASLDWLTESHDGPEWDVDEVRKKMQSGGIIMRARTMEDEHGHIILKN